MQLDHVRTLRFTPTEIVYLRGQTGTTFNGEFTGLGYYAEVPGVIFDVQRVGPSTGLPTRTAQGDILQIVRTWTFTNNRLETRAPPSGS